jgi:hypothetical protein
MSTIILREHILFLAKVTYLFDLFRYINFSDVAARDCFNI